MSKPTPMPHAHTPVEWIVELANVGDDPLDSVEHVIVTEGNREIADCGRAAHKANHTRARLIAAAPAMLEALQATVKAAKLANEIQHNGVKVPASVWAELYQTTNAASAVITRATGRERGGITCEQ